jgi:septum formation protein
MKQIVLASQSKQRQELLLSLGILFKVVAADIDELSVQDLDDAVRARKVAEAKAAKIRLQFPTAVIVAADTFMVANHQRLEKPLDLTEARQTLAALSGQQTVCFTGWVYSDPENHIFVSRTTETQVSFRPLSEREIERHVTTYPVTEWAGSFSTVYTPGVIASIQGSLTSVQGLPLEELVPLLQQSNLI